MKKNCEVESIEIIDKIGNYGAILSLSGTKSHKQSIKVIGTNLTECIERTYIVLQAFNTNNRIK